MSYKTLASYLGMIGVGWLLASWYYGEDIAELKHSYEKEKKEAVERTVIQHNVLAEEDRILFEGVVEKKITSADYFTKLEEETRSVKINNDGCLVNPDIVRLWNNANRGEFETNAPGTNGLHGALQKNTSAFYPFDVGSKEIFSGGKYQSYDFGKSLSRL